MSKKRSENPKLSRHETFRCYKLRVALPFLEKGRVFWFDDDTGQVYSVQEGKLAKYPLRYGLASYLWLLMTDCKYMKQVDLDFPGFEK